MQPRALPPGYDGLPIPPTVYCKLLIRKWTHGQTSAGPGVPCAHIYQEWLGIAGWVVCKWHSPGWGRVVIIPMHTKQVTSLSPPPVPPPIPPPARLRWGEGGGGCKCTFTRVKGGSKYTSAFAGVHGGMGNMRYITGEEAGSIPSRSHIAKWGIGRWKG